MNSHFKSIFNIFAACALLALTFTTPAIAAENTIGQSSAGPIPGPEYYSLGNRVWLDTNNSSAINGTETGINGVTVNLYAAGNLTAVIATDTTANGGYYLFNDLNPGDYVISIDSSNFGGVLNGYWSSGTSRTPAGAITEITPAAANSDTDSDDNGMLQTSGTLNGSVISSVITLGPSGSTEPTGEIASQLESGVLGNQGNQPDDHANMTVDFGFYTITLGDTVWNDLDNSGLLNGLEAGIVGVEVELRSGDNSASLATISTNGSGYLFSGLPAGDYIIRLPATNFNPVGILRDYRSSTGPIPSLAYEPAPDADTNTNDSDDNGSEANGLLGLGGYIQTLPITLTPANEQSFDNKTGTTSESRVDLGVNQLPQIDLTVTKTDNQNYYTVGGTLNYIIVVTNHGPADAIGITVNDTRPVQISSWIWTCAIGTPSGYNCTDNASNPSTFTDTVDLPQLASITYHVTAQVAPTAAGNLTNTVFVAPPIGMTDMTPYDNIVSDIDNALIQSVYPIFSDVPFTHWANNWIERLYNARVTDGCNNSPMLYCPDASATRAQMTIFILRSKYNTPAFSYMPPPATGTVFADVPLGSFADAWIEQLALEGITSGCGGGNYCPDTPITRAEMAIFLLRGKHGSAYNPPAATGTIFTDVPLGSFADAWIEQLASEGITTGCGNGNYCPGNPVTRAEMAVFLVKAFGLP